MLKVIGLCGGSGSGKGAVSSIFAKNGYLTIDTDMVYRDITGKKSQCFDALVAEFGNEILNQNGILDRKKLGDIVFSDREKLKKLNSIAHKHVLSEVRASIENAATADFKGVVVDAPLLFESGFDSDCDLVIAVIASKDIRIERIMKRDSISFEAALKRVNSQLSDEFLISRADFLIENNGDTEALEDTVKNILSKAGIMEKFHNSKQGK